MPFALVTAGLVMIVTGASGCHLAFGKMLAGEFSGKPNFAYWLATIGGLGALGYIPVFASFSVAFMTLVIIAMVLSNGGVFAKLTQALQSGPATVAGGDAVATAEVTNTSASTLNSQVQSGAVTPQSALQTWQSGATGEPATSSGQAKANGWINYGLGLLFGG